MRASPPRPLIGTSWRPHSTYPAPLRRLLPHHVCQAGSSRYFSRPRPGATGRARPVAISFFRGAPLGGRDCPPLDSITIAHAREMSLAPPPRPLDQIIVTLASVAIGEPYESSLQKMRDTAAAGGFGKTLLWKRDDFLADPLAKKHRASLEQMQRGHAARKLHHPWDRPYCGSFKAFVLLRALEQSREGDCTLAATRLDTHTYRHPALHSGLLSDSKRRARFRRRPVVGR